MLHFLIYLQTQNAMNQTSYCNPISLSDYPKGMWVPLKKTHDYGWIFPEERKDFRETADPCVLYHENKWYLYVSCGSAYVSEDFINWTHHPIEPYNLEYDPRVIKHRGEFIFTASRSPLYRSKSPLGPFEKMGEVVDPGGKAVTWGAPHIVVDDDGRVYGYWGIGGPGIYGAEMDPDNLCQLITEPKILMSYNPENRWERFGDNNEDPGLSFVEGPWVHRHNGRYYLTYSAPGTEWKTYAFGYYVSDDPLGCFEYGEGNPFVIKAEGYVHGTGHGCLAEGPNKTIWAFYTCLVRNEHNFERRVGYDQVHFDANGVPHCEPTEIPQLTPGQKGTIEWIPLTSNRSFKHSSCDHRNAAGLYALDNCMKTWWLPSREDVQPALEVYLKQAHQKRSTFLLRSVRLHWKENFLDYESGKPPKPIGYRIEYKSYLDDPDWKIALDLTENIEDRLIDYRELPEAEAQVVRLVITESPYPGELGVIDFTVFGESGNSERELMHMDD